MKGCCTSCACNCCLGGGTGGPRKAGLKETGTGGCANNDGTLGTFELGVDKWIGLFIIDDGGFCGEINPGAGVKL